MQSGSAPPALAMRGELRRPVQPLARAQRRLAVLDAQLHAIAVELDLMHPARAGRRPLDQLGRAAARRSRASPRPSWPWPWSRARSRPCRRRPSCCSPRPRRPRASCAVMKGVGALPLPSAISSMVRPEATDLGSFRSASLVALARGLVAMLDQQPVGALAAACGRASCAPAPSCPAAARLEDEFQVALLQPVVRIAFRHPVAAIPQLHRAAAILALREWCLRSRRSRADGPRPRPPAACRADRARGPASPPRT